MQKLVILLEGLESQPEFDEAWPQFLHLAEQMPGLLRESTSRVSRVLYGSLNCTMIHELYFENLEALQQALASQPGQQAGQLLQRISKGRLSLLVGDHNQDDLENISKHRAAAQAEIQPAIPDEPDSEPAQE
jgi:hypothetical protein